MDQGFAERKYPGWGVTVVVEQPKVGILDGWGDPAGRSTRLEKGSGDASVGSG